MTRRVAWLDLAMGAVLAGAVLAFFWRAALLQGTFFVQDVMVQNYPFRDFFSRALKDFALPLWCPEINCGFALFAEGQAGVLYLYNLLAAFLLPTYAALNYNIILHFWLAGLGTYGFLRALGCARAAALTGGLTYACGGFLVVRAMSPNFVDVCAWMPVLFLLVERALQHRRLVFLALAAGVVGLQFLAGHPQATVYSAGAVMLFAAYRGAVERPSWNYWLAVLLGVPLVGAVLGAVQLLPTAEMAWESTRGQAASLDRFLSMSLPPERLVALLLPNSFGNSSTGSYWSREAGFYIQLCGYMGIAPLLLSWVALRERRDPHTGFFCGLSALALILVLGRFTGVFELLYHVPGLELFRIPARFLLFFSFGVAVLAGLGLDHVLTRPAGGRRARWLGLCLLLAGLAGGMGWLNRDVLLASTADLPGGVGGTMARYQTDLGWDLVRCVLVLGGTALILILGDGRRLRRVALAGAAPLLVYADLYSFGHGFNGVIDPQVYLRTPDSASFIRRDADGPAGMAPRLLSLVSERNSPYDWHGGWAHDQGSYGKYPETLRHYTGSQYGLANVLPGWSPLHPARHWEFARGYPAFMSLAGVGHVVSFRPLPYAGLDLAFEGEVKVYRNPEALPRAYLVRDYRVLPDPVPRLRYLRSSAFDPRRQVVLEKPPRVQPGALEGEGPVVPRFVAYGPEEIELELGEHHGGLLVLSDTHYPGWRAYVDGQESGIMRANHVFRAVEVPAAARQVTFRFQSDSFRLGALISAIGALAWLVWLAWLARRPGAGLLLLRPRAEPEADAGPFAGPGRQARVWSVQAVLVVLIHALATQWPLWAQALERSRALAALGAN